MMGKNKKKKGGGGGYKMIDDIHCPIYPSKIKKNWRKRIPEKHKTNLYSNAPNTPNPNHKQYSIPFVLPLSKKNRFAFPFSKLPLR